MLQVYLFGPTEEGFLHLNPGTVLEMENTLPLFAEDLSIGEFSIPIEVPWTDGNRKLMGFNERHQNFVKRDNFFRCHVYDDLLPEMTNAKFTILERKGDMGYRRGSFSASISGTQGLYGSLIKNKKLTDLTLGGKISWTGMDSRQFANSHAAGTYPQYHYISFAPVGFDNYFDSGRTDYTTEFMAKNTANNVVAIRPGVGLWTFGRPNPANANQALAPGQAAYEDYRTIPFFNLKYVLRKCFEEYGYTVSGDFMSSPDFDYLYLFNNYSIEQYAVAAHRDFNSSIFPKDHVPDISIRDFISRLCAFFNMYPVFNGFNCDFRYRTAALKDKRQVSINNIIAGGFVTTPADVDNDKGYKLDYEWDAADGYPSDRVKDPKEKTLVATVTFLNDLNSVNPGYQLTTNHIVFVEMENMYYVVADATTTPVLWEVWAERLREIEVAPGEKDVVLPVSTLCQYVIKNPVSALMERQPYLGCSQLGSYYAHSGARVLNSFDLRLFYIRKIAINFTDTVPASFAFNRGYAGQVLAKYNLALAGTDGLEQNFHREWLKFMEQAEVTTVPISMDRRILNELTNANIFEANNISFLPKKIGRSIPMQTVEDIEMVSL